MDEPALRAFLSLAQTENTRDTAALLRVNQSNVSRAVARLEEHLGIDLFVRRGKRLVLSRAGAAFRADAAAVLDSLERARRHAESMAAETPLVRIGFLHSTARWLVPDVVQAFRAERPSLRVSLRQGFARELYAWLDADAVDVVVGTPPPPKAVAPVGDLVWRTLAEEELCIAVRRDDALASRDTAEVRDIDSRDFIGFSQITEMRAVVDAIVAESGASLRVAFESSEIDTMRALVAGGLGVSILPRTPGREASGDPVSIPLRPAHSRALGIGWSLRGPAAGLVAALATRLQPAVPADAASN